MREPTTMAPTAAAWIHDVVLPAGYRRNSAPIDRCACQLGVCGACERGDHRRCLVRQWRAVDPATRHGRPRPTDAVCETHIVSRDWMVAGVLGVHNEVWRAGRPCRYLCPCDCPAELHPGVPPPARRRRQPSGGNAHVRGLAEPDQPELSGLAVPHG